MKEWLRPLDFQHTMWVIANVGYWTGTLDETGRSYGDAASVSLLSTWKLHVHPWTHTVPLWNASAELHLNTLLRCTCLLTSIYVCSFMYFFQIVTWRHTCACLSLMSTRILKCSYSPVQIWVISQEIERLKINSTPFGSRLARSCQGKTDCICWSAKENFIDWLTRILTTLWVLFSRGSWMQVPWKLITVRRAQVQLRQAVISAVLCAFILKCRHLFWYSSTRSNTYFLYFLLYFIIITSIQAETCLCWRQFARSEKTACMQHPS